MPGVIHGALVTGTDTGVGKTVVAACIAAALRARGLRVAAVKPVVTGLDDPEPGSHPDHELLAMAAGVEPASVTARTFGPPLSPHLAAELAGTPLDPAELLAAARASAAGADILIAEGVGGLMVPLTMGDGSDDEALGARHENGGSNDGCLGARHDDVGGSGHSHGVDAYLIRDYARDLGLPLVIAARPGLGTINHTLLTIEAARASGLHVLGVVLTPWPEVPSTMELSNRSTIARIAAVEVDVLPHVALTGDALASAGSTLRATASLEAHAARVAAA